MNDDDDVVVFDEKVDVQPAPDPHRPRLDGYSALPQPKKRERTKRNGKQINWDGQNTAFTLKSLDQRGNYTNPPPAAITLAAAAAAGIAIRQDILNAFIFAQTQLWRESSSPLSPTDACFVPDGTLNELFLNRYYRCQRNNARALIAVTGTPNFRRRMADWKNNENNVHVARFHNDLYLGGNIDDSNNKEPALPACSEYIRTQDRDFEVERVRNVNNYVVQDDNPGRPRPPARRAAVFSFVPVNEHRASVRVNAPLSFRGHHA